MRPRARWSVLLVTVLGVCLRASAEEPGAKPASVDLPAPAVSARAVPGEILSNDVRDTLPEYHLEVRLETAAHYAQVTQRVRWTNLTSTPTDRLVFHVYPNHRPNEKQLFVYQRTIESLRLDPRTALDKQGRRVRFQSVRCRDVDLKIYWDAREDTILIAELPQAVASGETVEITLQYRLTLPQVQGRTGQYKDVTNLLNWYPILAYYDDSGWDHTPYVAWHQPWHNEAGNYTVELKVPKFQQIASSGHVVNSFIDEQGFRHHSLVGRGIRDFSIVASHRFETFETEVDGIVVKIIAFPEHQFHARIMLQTVTECLQQYAQWFGPYPHKEFTIVESYFGWNGNESSGLVMIDARIFELPRIGYRYVDHLVSHEIMHQWWYSTVGTDGYREPWMDESLVAYLTEVRMEQKYGRDPRLFDFPEELGWLPNVNYQTLIHSGYYLYRGRGGQGKSLASLDEIGHLHNLFFLVYDRGNRVVKMIHHRMGTKSFFEFLRLLYAKYQFRILRVADFKRELEEFTGENWDQFFDDWLGSSKGTDWKVSDVDVDRQGEQYRVTIEVEQKAEINEPVSLGFRYHKDGPLAGEILLQPDLPFYQVGNAEVRKVGEREWEVVLITPEKPAQIELDPDGWLLDENPRNNRWKCDPALRVTPFYSPIDDAAIVHAVDRPSIVAGPGVDLQGRLVLRGTLIHMHKLQVSPFLAFNPESQRNLLSAGAEAILHNVPGPNLQLGARYEHSLNSDLFADPDDQGRLFLRWIKTPTTSILYPHNETVEVFFRFGDNFFPNADIRRPPAGVEDYRDIRAVGITYHADTRLPYWNPDSGFAFDATFEHGFHAFGDGESFNRVHAQISTVQRLPEGLGDWSRTKLAGRIAGGIGSPDHGEHFRFGGGTRFRGRRSEDHEGSRFWLASLDWRFPILGDLDWMIHDNYAKVRSLYGSVFYDVGESYLSGSSRGVDHAVGAGLYFDVPLVSFVENLTIRLEYGYNVRDHNSILWFGWYHAF